MPAQVISYIDIPGPDLSDRDLEINFGTRLTTAEAAISDLEDAATAHRYSITNGIFEWWIHPTATYLATPYPRTVFGAEGNGGEILACEFNHITGGVLRYQVGTSIVDDHCPPALWIEDGRRPVIIWTLHNANQFFYYKVGNAAGDIASLVAGAALVHGIGAPDFPTYPQIHKITSLSDASQDTFWLFYRFQSFAWHRSIFSVAQSDGAVTWGVDTALLASEFPDQVGGQVYAFTADAFDTGSQAIRLSVGYNPDSSRESIWYYDIDVTTGAITTPADGAFSANMDGTNLPIALATATPIIDEPTGTVDRHMFACRPGPDGPAIGYAEWDRAAPDDCVYKVTEISPDGRYLDSGTATVAADAQLQVGAGQGLSITVAGRLPASVPATAVDFARRWTGAGGAPSSFRLQIKTDKHIFANHITAADSLVNVTSPNPVPCNWGDDVGLRYTLDDAGNQLRLYYTLNPLASVPTWTLLHQEAMTDGVHTSTQPLIIGAVPPNIALQRLYYCELRNITTDTVLAGVDWRSEWVYGDSTFIDDYGMSWSTSNGAAVVLPTNTTTLGPAGPIFGNQQANGYYPGVAFETPSYARNIITAEWDADVSSINVYTPVGDVWTPETLYSQVSTNPASHEGRLIRPYVPVNGGPLRVLFADINNYAFGTYTVYDTDIKAR